MHVYVCVDTAYIPSAVGTQFMDPRTELTEMDAEEKSMLLTHPTNSLVPAFILEPRV